MYPKTRQVVPIAGSIMGQRFFQTAETGNRTPDSSVKGSSANHYPTSFACWVIVNTEWKWEGHSRMSLGAKSNVGGALLWSFFRGGGGWEHFSSNHKWYFQDGHSKKLVNVISSEPLFAFKF